MTASIRSCPRNALVNRERIVVTLASRPMSRRALHPLFSGGPTMRVENAAEMSAADGWSADVLTFPPAKDPPAWEWGEVIVGAPPSKRDWRLSRARWEASRFRAAPDFDALHPHYATLDGIVRDGAYGIVHWKNLDGALKAAELAHRHGCAFVLDLHKNHPYNMWSTARDSGLRGRLYDVGAWFDYERRATERAD